MSYSCHNGNFVIDSFMVSKLRAWVDHAEPIGGFLRAVLENNLKEACGRADSSNLANLPAFVSWLYNEAPSDCWGSPAKVAAWEKLGGLAGVKVRSAAEA
jgi:hypothetical protein